MIKHSDHYFCKFCSFDTNENHKICPACGKDNLGKDTRNSVWTKLAEIGDKYEL